MKVIEAFVEIDAPPAAVWEALVGFDSYPEWDPIERRIVGVAVDTETVRWRGTGTADSGLLDGPIAVTVDPPRRLAWLDRLVVPFALDRYHEFHLEPTEGGRQTRLLQRETVRGAFVPFTFDEERVERAFVELNEAIAARAERRASAVA